VRFPKSATGVRDRSSVPVTDATGPLERSAQTLPVPLGGLAPAHRSSTVFRRSWQRHRSVPAIVLALVAGGSGVWLSISQRDAVAGEDAAGVHVGDMTLTPLSDSVLESKVFTGAATMVISTMSSTTVRSAAVMTWNNAPTTGRCTLVEAVSGTAETCDYMMGTTRLTSIDTFDSRTRIWHRHYGDGVEITITVPTHDVRIPIPFPLGR
jgi:hypothetical protein